MPTIGSRVLPLGLVLLACSSERGPRRDAWSYEYAEHSGCLDGSPPTCQDYGNQNLSVIELEDDPNNSTLRPCDTGGIRSPGADIDAAELNAGTFLSGCQITGATSCGNDSASASQAEGSPDATGPEETGTYTSLNGGLLRCRFTNGAAVTSSDNITVIEIGASSDTSVEQYRIRLCDSLSGECQRNSAYASGEVSFSGADLF